MAGEQPLRILVVDDDDSVRKSMAAILMLDRFDVQTASDGQKALRAAANTHFDIIFIDSKMPGISGLDTFLELKKVTPRSVVAIMTAYAAESMKKKALKLGVYALYIKPFNVHEVVKSIVDNEFSARQV